MSSRMLDNRRAVVLSGELGLPVPLGAEALRRQAEALVHDLRAKAQDEDSLLAPEQIQKALHELHVHEIQLEMQNEELRRLMAELDRTRAHYFDLYDLAPVGYCTLSQSGQILQANLMATELLGVPRDALSQKPFVRFVQKEDQDSCYLMCQRVLTTGQAQSRELRMHKSDDRLIWVYLQAIVIHDDDGVAQLRLVLIDISERKQHELELMTAKIEAVKANRDKSHFLASASHDLRQPIFALSLFFDSLKRRLAPDDLDLATKIESCIKGLSELLTDLLDVSKLEAGVTVPEPSDFSVDEMQSNLIDIHVAKAHTKGLRLRWRDCGLIGHTDRTLLSRIVANFLDNAIQYTRRGGVLIACRPHDGRHWIEVWDTGIGIAHDKFELIFEAYQRVDDATPTRGSGLGLAIASEMADLLGLEIRLRSRPGRGSMFAIELPLGKQIESAPAPRLHSPVRRLRVALVDDDSLVLPALTLALEEVGHEVIAASNGKALLKRLGQRAPDILVSDYRLAGAETGFNVIAVSREIFGSALPALLITGDTNPDLIRSMAQHGIKVLYKPVKIDALQAAIREAMQTGSELNCALSVA